MYRIVFLPFHHQAHGPKSHSVRNQPSRIPLSPKAVYFLASCREGKITWHFIFQGSNMLTKGEGERRSLDKLLFHSLCSILYVLLKSIFSFFWICCPICSCFPLLDLPACHLKNPRKHISSFAAQGRRLCRRKGPADGSHCQLQNEYN